MEMQLASVNQLNFLENRTTGWIRKSNRLLFFMIHQGEVEGRHLGPLQFRSFFIFEILPVDHNLLSPVAGNFGVVGEIPEVVFPAQEGAT